MDDPVEFEIAQAECSTGGWADDIPPTPQEIKDAESRWAERSYEYGVKEDPTDDFIERQCGGCHYFAALGADYGLCWNKKSPLDGCVTFEHGGCKFHSEYGPGGYKPA